MGGGWASEACTIGSSTRRQLEILDDRFQPLGDGIGLLEPAQRVVVSKSERRHAAFAFALAELERLQRQAAMCLIRVFSAAGETNSSAYRRPFGLDDLSAKRLNCSGRPTFLRE
jgi:hypothetical protein